MSRRLAQTVLALALLAACLALAACGEKPEDQSGGATPFNITLDFYPNADHVGIYEAQKLGYFTDAGLDVKITTPTDPAAPIKEVAAGRTDLAISYEPELLLARDQGLDVKAVAALVNRPLTSLIWLGKSGIKGVGDLRGKTIATAGIPYQDAFLKTILARAKLSTDDVKTVGVGLNLLPALLGNKAQAMLGGFSNVEGIDLKMRNKHPTVLPVDQLGVPTYDELVMVAKTSSIGNSDDAQAIRLFLGALARGTAAAVQNPAQATQALVEQNQDLDPKLTAAEVQATLPALSQPSAGQPFGYMDATQWKAFIAWMRDNGLITSLPTPGSVLTEGLLPGTIPG